MTIQLLDFYADWCGPCIVMEPIIEELKKELAGKVEIKKINVDQNQQEAMKFGVFSIPTFIVLKDGQEVDRLVGATSKENMKSRITAHLS